MTSRKQKKNKIRSIRLSDKVWEELNKIKKNGESWDLLVKKLININELK